MYSTVDFGNSKPQIVGHFSTKVYYFRKNPPINYTITSVLNTSVGTFLLEALVIIVLQDIFFYFH